MYAAILPVSFSPGKQVVGLQSVCACSSELHFLDTRSRSVARNLSGQGPIFSPNPSQPDTFPKIKQK